MFISLFLHILKQQPESDGSRSGSSLSLRNLDGNNAGNATNSSVHSPQHRGVHRSISTSSTKPSRRSSSGGETLRKCQVLNLANVSSSFFLFIFFFFMFLLSFSINIQIHPCVNLYFLVLSILILKKKLLFFSVSSLPFFVSFSLFFSLKKKNYKQNKTKKKLLQITRIYL